MRRIITIAAATGAAMSLSATAASAGEGGGWQPYRTKPITDVGVCSFTVQGDVVRDEEEYRTVATFPDGSPRIRQYRGPLVIKFTNTSNGRSVIRDVSGDATVRYRADKTMIWAFDGGASVRVHIGNKGYPAGDYILHGKFTLVIHPDGNRDLPRLHATVEDLCRTLA